MMEMEISMAGHSFASLVERWHLPVNFGTVNEMINGYSFYNYIKELIDNFNAEKLEKLQNIYNSVFSKNRLTLSVMSAQKKKL